MAKTRIHDNKLKSFERNVRFLGRGTLIENHRTVFALMNSFLAEHFGHSLSLSFSPFPRSFLSDFRLLISVADAGIAGFSFL